MFSVRLKELREEKGFSQRRLAEFLTVSKQNIRGKWAVGNKL